MDTKINEIEKITNVITWFS